MNDTPYPSGGSRHRIEQALHSAGKDLDNLQPADLAPLEDFHTMGRLATAQLVDLIGITSDSAVLDAGTGIGGTARYVADRCGCTVTAVDMTEDYCLTARWLNRLVGLHNQITVHQADVTDLPFPDATFDVVFSQHVQMNVADKPRLYREAHRVLRGRGSLAIWDVADGATGTLDYPLPWANQPEPSHLVTTARLRELLESSGFTVTHWHDLTEQAAATMQVILALPPSPLGLHNFVDDFADRVKNLTAALSDQRLRVVQAIAQADSG
jgi:sarcosine/dimethylglycine N-methyltransferase